MGQKVSPIGIRLGIIREWDSKWYASKAEVPALLHEDLKIRKVIEDYYKRAQVSRVVIERFKSKIMIIIYTAKPGAVIGREGQVKNDLVAKLQKMTGKTVFMNVVEIKNPDLDAKLVAQKMAEDLENRALL